MENAKTEEAEENAHQEIIPEAEIIKSKHNPHKNGKNTAKNLNHPKQSKPTYKQEIFCQEYVKTKGNGLQSAKKAYNLTPTKNIGTTASAIANENLKKPIVINRINELLKLNNLDLDNLTRKHAEIINATKQIVCDKSIINVPDYPVQLEATKLGYKLNQVLDSHAPKEQNNTLIIANPSDTKALENILGVLSRLNEQLGLSQEQTGEVL